MTPVLIVLGLVVLAAVAFLGWFYEHQTALYLRKELLEETNRAAELQRQATALSYELAEARECLRAAEWRG